MVTQEEYEDAKNNPSIRNRFLKRINFEEKTQYISKVRYSGKKQSFWMVCRKNFLNNKSKIIVTGEAFELLPTLGDFLSCLVDHEGCHTQQIYRGQFKTGFMAYFQKSSLLSRGEVEAHENQMKNYKKRNVSSEVREILAKRLKWHETQLKLEEIIKN